MQKHADKLPMVTILIEWDNALDVDDYWVQRAMQAFEAELERCQPDLSAPPRVMYLYDQTTVKAQDIQEMMANVAPKIPGLCQLELVPTPGLNYYRLKNYGVQRTATDLVVMLDSDAAPQPGWLPELLKPFADPDVMAVAGFTVLGHNNLSSRMMALTWTFNLPSERDATVKRKKIHANNCAFRTAFFQANPWPELHTHRKQCGFWLRDIERRGIKWVRTAAAMTVHAPQPGIPFLIWRAWASGRDHDFQAHQTVSPSRLGRLGAAVHYWLKKCWRATRRIVSKGHEVDVRVWQIPAVLFLAYGYYTILLTSQMVAALTHRYTPSAQLHKAAQS